MLLLLLLDKKVPFWKLIIICTILLFQDSTSALMKIVPHQMEEEGDGGGGEKKILSNFLRYLQLSIVANYSNHLCTKLNFVSLHLPLPTSMDRVTGVVEELNFIQASQKNFGSTTATFTVIANKSHRSHNWTNEDESSSQVREGQQDFEANYKIKGGHGSICSLFFTELVSTSHNSSELLQMTAITLKKTTSLFLQEGLSIHNFYLILIDPKMTGVGPGNNLNIFLKSIKKLERVYMVAYNGPSLMIRVFRPNFLFNEDLELVAIFELNKMPPTVATHIISCDDNEEKEKNYRNLAGRQMRVTVIPTSQHSVDEYEKSGVWLEINMAVVYEITKKFNASLELEAVMSLPREFPDENGEWDDFVAPLMTGDAVMSHATSQTEYKQTILYLSDMIIMVTGGFVVARPTLFKFSSLTVLQTPLDDSIWIFILLTFLGSLITLKLTMEKARWKKKISTFRHFEEEERSQKKIDHHDPYITFSVFVRPILDQGSWTSDQFSKMMDNGPSSRLIIGLWLGAIVVLSGLYKSQLVVNVSLPRMVNPPTNFEELLKSKYKLGMVLYTGNYDKYFNLPGNTLGHAIVERGFQEFTFYEKDFIFEHPGVCIGPTMLAEVVGTEFMMDVKARKMFQVSTDTIVPVPMGIGLSKHYPALLDPINFLVQSFHQGGFTRHAYLSMMIENGRKGQQNARNWVDQKGYYSGKQYEGHEGGQKTTDSDRQFTLLACQLLARGIFLCGLSFVFEYFF